MSNRKVVQELLKLSSGVFLGVIKRGAVNNEFLKSGFIDSADELDEWREELIVELYNETIDEVVDMSRVVSTEGAYTTTEEYLGALDYMLNKGVATEGFKNQRILLIRKLYNDLDHVKEFNDIINDLETEGEEQ